MFNDKIECKITHLILNISYKIKKMTYIYAISAFNA